MSGFKSLSSIKSLSSTGRGWGGAASFFESPEIKGNTRPEPEGAPGIGHGLAVIGMSGRFPMAEDLDQFWDNLVKGRDCITEIPRDRWDWRAVYGDPRKESNKTHIKWGGFIDSLGDFDSMFFGISPKEAALMDPQQRLLMEYVWRVIEDAGYSPESLAGSRTGIFIGTGSSGYTRLITDAKVDIEGYSAMGVVPSLGPNRMSHLLDLRGPSEPVETACSSSLVAVHRAMVSIWSGCCDAAIVGGVNTMVTPDGHISFDKAGMLCEDGRCKTFSAKADGYVRGEGVGMLFLKRLSDAEQAGDRIYAVLRGSAVNHGGRANSLTSPNPRAQADLLKAAYTKAGIDPGSVGYIEAHGTGTELGDPIEINALKTAFQELAQDPDKPPVKGPDRVEGNGADPLSPHCGLGSVKSNIGHLELAAGIAGMIKVLLQLQHKTLVKTLHCQTVNPYIQLEESPFYLVRENRAWAPLRDAEGRSLPLRAGVSAFGFGGVNAHVIVEEYPDREGKKGKGGKKGAENAMDNAYVPQPVVLSAMNEERLKAYAENLLAFLQKKSAGQTAVDLRNLAYTLQVGRKEMAERLGIVAQSLPELEEKLEAFVSGETGIKMGMDGLYRGRAGRSKAVQDASSPEEEMEAGIEEWIRDKKYSKILSLWVKGYGFDWNRLYSDAKPRRISLPTYPFARKRYWIPEKINASQEAAFQLLKDKHPHRLEPLKTSVKSIPNPPKALSLAGDEKEMKKQVCSMKPRGISLSQLSDASPAVSSFKVSAKSRTRSQAKSRAKFQARFQAKPRTKARGYRCSSPKMC